MFSGLLKPPRNIYLCKKRDKPYQLSLKLKIVYVILKKSYRQDCNVLKIVWKKIPNAKSEL